MSGLEVIGIVLGGIPLIISALEHYKDGTHAIQIWRKYKTELASVIRQLRVQQSRLTNVCETLLEGLGLGGRIEAMIKEPFGSLWHDEGTKKKLTQRLHRDYGIFEETVVEMSVAIEDIKKRIGLGPTGKIDWIQSSSWRRELKRASFTFDRSEYKDLLCILKEGNDCLETLTRYNKDLEPKRKRRIDSHYLNLLRSVSDNVFRALQNSLSCSCDHGLGLELHPQKARRSLNQQDYETVSAFVFRVGISETKIPGRYWKEVRLAPSGSIQHGLDDSVSTSLPHTPHSLMSLWRPSSTTNPDALGSEPTAVYTQTHQITTNSPFALGATKKITVEMAGVPTGRQPTQITDLCTTVLGRMADPPSSFCGFVLTHEVMDFSQFEVHAPIISKGRGRDLITLDRLLRDGGGDFLGQITYTQKLRLAYLVSYAVLQLSERSWLADNLSSKDIIFLRENEWINYQRVFIGRGIFDQDPPPIPSKKTIGKRSRNHTLLALAKLLIEIMLQCPFEKLRESTSPWDKAAIRDARSDLDAAQGLATRVNNEFGSSFGSAIRRCIHGDFDCESTSMEDEDFRQEFYAGVVVLLEENMKYAGLA